MSTTETPQQGHDGLEQDVKDMLRTATNAGASGAFVMVLATEPPAYDDGHYVRRKVRRHGAPGPWGDFMTALWEGHTTKAWRLADMRNRRLLRAAGLEPKNAL